MGEDSKIQWTNHTFNGVRGCAKKRNQEADLSDSGCLHCYAESMSKRNPKLLGIWGEEGTRVLASEAMWREPERWNREAKAKGERARVFAYSLGDVFEHPRTVDNLLVCETARQRLWPLIEATDWLDWMLLTKRPEHIRDMVPPAWLAAWPANAWIGASVEDQHAANERIPHLLQVRARVRFLSCEPLLGPLNLRHVDIPGTGWSCDPLVVDDERPGLAHLRHVDLVIVGGESGHGARPFDLAWARSIVRQCKEAGVACFVKQLGAAPRETTVGPSGAWSLRSLADKKGGDPSEWPSDLRVREMPRAT